MKGGQMKDRKFLIALIIIVVLALALLYVALIGPKVQGYVVNKQIEAQQSTVDAIVSVVNQQGYVVLGEGEGQVILVPYQVPEQGAGLETNPVQG
jgi:predicted Abi (CAAX) family protease